MHSQYRSPQPPGACTLNSDQTRDWRTAGSTALWVLAIFLSAFVSLLAWIGTGFGPADLMAPLMLTLPAVLVALFSFRISALALAALLVRSVLYEHWSFLRPGVLFDSPFDLALLGTVLVVIAGMAASPFRSVWANFRHMARD